MTRCFVRCVLLCLSLLSQLSWADSLTAQLDRTEITEQESFRLRLVLDGSQTGQPDFSQLDADFEILGQSSSSQFSSINGRASRQTLWDLQLVAKRTGDLQIPAIQLGALQSQPLPLRVLTENQPLSNQAPLQIELQAPDSGWPEQPLTLTLRLLLDSSCQRRPDPVPELIAPQGTSISLLGDARQFQKQINHKSFLVYEQDYRFRSSQSGLLELPPIHYKAQMLCPDSDRVKLLRVATETKRLQIHAKPDGYQGWWLPTDSLNLSETFAEGPYRVGEPINRQVRLVARGVQPEQLPEVPKTASSGLKIYADPPKLSQQNQGSQLYASREESLSLLPTQAGELRLPPIRIEYFNTQSGKLESAELPARVLQIQPSVASSSSPTETTTSHRSATAAETGLAHQGWFWLSLTLALSHLFWLWRDRQRSSHPATPDLNSAAPRPDLLWQQFKLRCQTHQALAASQALRALLGYYQQPRDLLQFAQQLPQPLQSLLQQLDRAASCNSAWSGTELWAQKALLEQALQPSKAAGKAPLSLNPS